ncbi:MAG: amidohydrolase [Planctomycetota bacterium]|jgi:predicted amidohydrolase YtcJ
MNTQKLLVALLLAITFGFATSVFGGPADTVAINGKIYTVNPKKPWAEAIAIKGGGIVYVGNNEGAKKYIGKDTTFGDLHGKFVMPGIVSGHEHPGLSAAFGTALYIEYSEDKDKMLKAVANYIRDYPDKPRMSWGGSYEGRVDITAPDIDKVTQEPFVMIAASGHGAWINTAALTAVGLANGEKAPVDGVERDAEGMATGYFSSSAAAMYVVVKLGLIKKEAVMEKFEEVVAEYNSNGITATNDAGNPPGTEPVIYSAVGELEKMGRLNLRISGSVTAQRPMHLERAFEILAGLTPRYQSEMFTVNTLKLHGGAPDGYSAPLLEPYTDRPDFSGPEIFPYDVRLEWSMKAAKLGYDIHTHVIGDRAIREALDSFEAIREAGYKDIKLSTGHSNMVHPADQPRYAKLNVTCNIFGYLNAVPDQTTLDRIGPERMKYWSPHGSLARLGTRLSMSADAPTAPLDPFMQIEVVMLRKHPDMKDALFPKKQALSLEQTIRAYTIDAAYQLGWEDKIGSLEAGKRADIVVLDRNLFETDPSEIHKTNVLLTMLNGKVVHEEAVDWDIKESPMEIDFCEVGQKVHHSHGEAVR